MVRRGGGFCQIAPGFSPGNVKQDPWRGDSGSGVGWQRWGENVGGVGRERRRALIILETGEMSFWGSTGMRVPI